MASIARTCYNRDGTPITDIAYQPCLSDPDRDSYCCGTNHQGAGHTNVANDVCESNGLCQNYEPFDGTNEGVKLWWRQGCTDPTRRSAESLASVCNEGIWQDDNAPVRKCGDNSWCCGEASCCSETTSLFTLAAMVGETASSASLSVWMSRSATSGVVSSSPTSSSPPIISRSPNSSASILVPPPSSSNSETSPTAIPPSSRSDTSTMSQKLSIGARAGIGVGAAATAVLVALVVLLAWKLKKKRQQEAASVELPYSPIHDKNTEMKFYPSMPPVELYAGNAAVELGCRGPSELGTPTEQERPYGLHDPKVVIQS